MKTIILDGVEYELKPIEKADKFTMRETYYYIDSIDAINIDEWCNTYSDKARIKANNCFKTKEAAEMELLRRESMANRWIPTDKSEMFYWWDIEGHSVITGLVSHSFLAVMSIIGAVHPTKEACKAWADKYAKAWEEILK